MGVLDFLSLKTLVAYVFLSPYRARRPKLILVADGQPGNWEVLVCLGFAEMASIVSLLTRKVYGKNFAYRARISFAHQSFFTCDSRRL